MLHVKLCTFLHILFLFVTVVLSKRVGLDNPTKPDSLFTDPILKPATFWNEQPRKEMKTTKCLRPPIFTSNTNTTQCYEIRWSYEQLGGERYSNRWYLLHREESSVNIFLSSWIITKYTCTIYGTYYILLYEMQQQQQQPAAAHQVKWIKVVGRFLGTYYLYPTDDDDDVSSTKSSMLNDDSFIASHRDSLFSDTSFYSGRSTHRKS